MFLVASGVNCFGWHQVWTIFFFLYGVNLLYEWTILLLQVLRIAWVWYTFCLNRHVKIYSWELFLFMGQPHIIVMSGNPRHSTLIYTHTRKFDIIVSRQCNNIKNINKYYCGNWGWKLPIFTPQIYTHSKYIYYSL